MNGRVYFLNNVYGTQTLMKPVSLTHEAPPSFVEATSGQAGEKPPIYDAVSNEMWVISLGFNFSNLQCPIVIIKCRMFDIVRTYYKQNFITNYGVKISNETPTEVRDSKSLFPLSRIFWADRISCNKVFATPNFLFQFIMIFSHVNSRFLVHFENWKILLSGKQKMFA